MLPNLKNIIIFGAIATMLVLGYLFFFNGSSEEAGLVSSGGIPGAINPADVPAITQDFLTILLNIKSLKLDDAVFRDPAFLSLRDSSILLNPEGNEGRPNPFAPIGFDPSPAPIAPPQTTPDPTTTTPPPVMEGMTQPTTSTTPPPATPSSTPSTTPPASGMGNSGATPN